MATTQTPQSGEIERGPYGFGRRLDVPYEQAIDQVKAALKAQGFGVLTEIDVKRTLTEKLGEQVGGAFRRYVILGACNPPLAHRSLTADLDIGLLLPCNVVVYEYEEDAGQGAGSVVGSVVRVMDPEAALGIVPVESLRSIAAEAKRRLEQAVAGLPG